MILFYIDEAQKRVKQVPRAPMSIENSSVDTENPNQQADETEQSVLVEQQQEQRQQQQQQQSQQQEQPKECLDASGSSKDLSLASYEAAERLSANDLSTEELSSQKEDLTTTSSSSLSSPESAEGAVDRAAGKYL